MFFVQNLYLDPIFYSIGYRPTINMLHFQAFSRPAEGPINSPITPKMSADACTSNNRRPSSSLTAEKIVIPAEASSTETAVVKIKASASTHNGHSSKLKMMTNLPKRPKAMIEYSDLTYTVYQRYVYFSMYK